MLCEKITKQLFSDLETRYRFANIYYNGPCIAQVFTIL